MTASREAHNVDSVLVNVINEQSNNAAAIPLASAPVMAEEKPVSQAENVESNENNKVDSYGEPLNNSNAPVNNSAEPNPNSNSETAKAEPSIDEYGNPLPKSKLYTEDEVQRLIRDRLSRGRHAETQQPHTQAEVKKASEDFVADPNSDETWEVQLERFIDRRLDTRQRQIEERNWREQEAKKQADFESRFTTGMGRYSDFHEVVANKPITNEMLLATRSLDNPAAFLYAASKLHPGELDSISKIQDPYAQAAKIGQLHERMIKESKVKSAAPKPLEVVKGDMVNQPRMNQPSIEQRIAQYAKQKRR